MIVLSLTFLNALQVKDGRGASEGEHAAMHCTRRRVMDGSCLLSPLGGREEALARLGRKRRKEGSKEHDFGQPGKGQPQPGSALLGQVKTGLDIGL